ncbi:MAG: hypothetical protein GY847_38220 [Proteobacteria bacterium]|nr:hypothetical protein [Pseudomonadota bacterium]
MQKQKPVLRFLRSTAKKRKWGRAWIRSLLFLPGPWLIIDRQKKIVIDGSRQVEMILACERDYYMGKPISSIAGQVDPSEWGIKEFTDETIELPGRYEDMGLKKADGSLVVVDMHVTHPPRSGQSVAMCLITDRTEQRRLQGELISKHQELRRAFTELEQTNRKLSITSAELSRATELAAIGEITAELTHQLNNPLAAAIGAARRLEKLINKSDTPQTKPMTELLKNSLDRLKKTVAELRRVYISSRPIEGQTEVFNIKSQINGALAMMQQRLEDLNVIVDLPEHLPHIIGRPSQIQHVIINLLDNAVEAAGPSGTVHLAARSDNGTVVLTLGDSGPGIPEYMREKIFEPFFTTREHGSGLGLAVVRRNLSHDRATISVRESKYNGAEFEIGFPIATEEKE